MRKSRSRRAWWVRTFFLGPVLLVILLFLPSLMGRSRFPILPSQLENLDKPFLMPIQHTRIQASMLPTFAPAAQGMIAAGQVERGKVRVGQEVQVVGLRPEALKQVVGRIGNGALRQRVDEGWPGDTVGIFLKGAQKEDVKRDMVLATPGSIAAHTRFTPEIHPSTEQEGGRDVPLLAPRTLQFTFRGFDVTGLVKPPPGTGTVTPGSSVVVEVELTTPIAIDKGLQFPVREVGGDNVGNGTVVDILL